MVGISFKGNENVQENLFVNDLNVNMFKNIVCFAMFSCGENFSLIHVNFNLL